jgi:quercetin dioxygenase-like cupin family protein
MPRKKTQITSKVDFSSLFWKQTAPGARYKSVVRKGRKLRLVEFTRRHEETTWCTKEHIGMVLSGEVEIEFANRVERYRAGDGIFILGGEAEKHIARVVTYMVRMVLVEKA